MLQQTKVLEMTAKRVWTSSLLTQSDKFKNFCKRAFTKVFKYARHSPCALDLTWDISKGAASLGAPPIF